MEQYVNEAAEKCPDARRVAPIRAQLFVYKLYTFFVRCNALVLPLLHFNSTLILYQTKLYDYHETNA